MCPVCKMLVYWSPKHVEQAIRSAIKNSIASNWHFISTESTHVDNDAQCVVCVRYTTVETMERDNLFCTHSSTTKTEKILLQW